MTGKESIEKLGRRKKLSSSWVPFGAMIALATERSPLELPDYNVSNYHRGNARNHFRQSRMTFPQRTVTEYRISPENIDRSTRKRFRVIDADETGP